MDSTNFEPERKNYLWLWFVILIFLAVVSYFGYKYYQNNKESNQPSPSSQTDDQSSSNI
jgi:predicted negative regulator of RcsB-dependent stress response